MRKQPGSPPALAEKQNDKVITQVRGYELITPLFGGGVAPAEADPVTIIRATEIRGQLRFWWRASRGGNPEFKGDPAEMKKAEDKIWGKAYEKKDTPTPQDETVQIRVEVVNPGTPTKLFRIEKDKRGRNQSKSIHGPGIGYVAFPLQPSQDELKQPNPEVKDVRSNVSFNLTISFPVDQKDEVETSLWAWETFGGIGARTRRGFGALHLLRVDGKNNSDLPPPNVQQAVSWLRVKLNRFIVNDKYPEGIPHLSHSVQFTITSLSQNGFAAWKTLTTKLFNFRQTPDGRSGRSNWPEPEAIRELTDRRDPKYKKLDHPQKFPRAAFGLPIIFHFKDGETGDPKDTILQGLTKGSDHNAIDRLASPLILRPVICTDNRAVGLALVLEGLHIPPGGLYLVEENDQDHPHSVDSKLTEIDARKISVLKGKTDVLKAFMNYLGGNTR